MKQATASLCFGHNLIVYIKLRESILVYYRNLIYVKCNYRII